MSSVKVMEWMTSSSVEKVWDLRGFDDLLQSNSSSQFCMDFLPSGASSHHHLPSPHLTSHWGAQASPPQPCDDGFNRGTIRESARLDCFTNGFFNQTKAVRERNIVPQYYESSRYPFLHYLAGMPDGHPTDTRHMPQEQDPFELDKWHFYPSSSAQVQHCRVRNQLRPSYHLNRPPTSPLPMSHHTDMMHYPPSYVLDRGPSLPLSSFPSPECWAFPPMRLY